MGKAIKKREAFFAKEILNFQKKEQTLQRNLEKLEAPVIEKISKLDLQSSPILGVKKDKKQLEDEQKKKEAEEKAKAEEEERLKKEEEAKAVAAAAEAKKGGAKKGAKQPVKKQDEEEVQQEVETEEQKSEKEKVVIKEQLELLHKKIEAYQAKVRLCHKNCEKVEREEKLEKFIDLKTRSDERKMLGNALEERADSVLGPRKAYILV